MSTNASAKQPDETNDRLRRIKKTDRTTAPVTLWLAYRYQSPQATDDTEADGSSPRSVLFHRVRRLEIDKVLADRLRGIVNRAIDSAKRLEDYTFEGAVERETALVEDTRETAFAEVLDLITAAKPDNVATKDIHLHRAYGYVIQLEPKKADAIYAFRKLSTSWKTRKLKNLIHTLLQDSVLITIEDENLFRFESKIDFFATAKSMFVLEKSNFESALNFRVGMEKKRDTLMAGLESCGLYDGLDVLKAHSGTHVRWLKKLASAQKHGKCTQSAWVDKVVAFCATKGWNVTKSDGRLLITANNCERVIRFMNYDILESPIDELLFEIDGAKHVVR